MPAQRQNGDLQFNVDFDEVGSMMQCPKCGNSQIRREQNTCEKCQSSMDETSVRQGWKTEARATYSGMEKIFPQQPSSSPAVSIKASRRNVQGQKAVRTAVFSIVILGATAYGIMVSYKLMIGEGEFKKLEGSVCSAVPELAPIIHTICE